MLLYYGCYVTQEFIGFFWKVDCTEQPIKRLGMDAVQRAHCSGKNEVPNAKDRICHHWQRAHRMRIGRTKRFRIVAARSRNPRGTHHTKTSIITRPARRR
ncbi:MAG: hypothetical protein NT133_11190 [Alphaproteobacteria bacterium]|nr:hypothetical protein [Alphaproteobacteria bacterium]